MADNLLSLLFMFIAVWLLGCEKDIPLQKGNCFEIPPSDYALGYERTGPNLTYGEPAFNPNNMNEIVCMKGTSSLIRYNLKTLERKQIFDQGIFSKPDWGGDNRIYFTARDFQIWRVQSNGENLMPLTDSAQNFAPDLSPDDKQIAITSERKKPGNRLYLFCIESGEYKNLTFQRTSGIDQPVWSPNGQWIAAFSNVLIDEEWQASLIAISPEQDTFQTITKIKRESSYDIAWLNSQKIIWSSKSGIYKTDWQGNQIRIKKSCDSKRYGPVSTSPNGKRILSERHDKKLTGENTLYSASKIVLMNADGSNERVILPEKE